MRVSSNIDPTGAAQRNRLNRVVALLPGVALSACIALLATLTSRVPWMQAHGLSALTLSIVAGMIIGNTIYPRLAGTAGAGVQYSRQTILRLGVMLFGLRLTLTDVATVGLTGVLIDAVMVTSTFLVAVYVGKRWLGVDQRTAMLIGAGSAICGAAAVLAAEPVVRGRAEQVTIAVATVVIFGTISMFLYPLLFSVDAQLSIIQGGTHGFGIYIGSTVHEVAQVVVAASSVGGAAADTAVITKLVRVMMLAPFLIALSWRLGVAEEARREGAAAASAAQRASPAIPWFAVGFFAVMAVNSTGVLPAGFVAWGRDADTLILATAMAALGLCTHASAFRSAGPRPLLLALLLLVWLVVGGAFVNFAVAKLLA